jgi:tubulin-folding cofactor B
MTSAQFSGTIADVPLIVKSANAESERRINPSWTIAYLKSRLEPITGVPASSQRLFIRVTSHDPVEIQAANEEATQLTGFGLQAYAELTASFRLLCTVITFAVDIITIMRYIQIM